MAVCGTSSSELFQEVWLRSQLFSELRKYSTSSPNPLKIFKSPDEVMERNKLLYLLRSCMIGDKFEDQFVERP